MMKSIHIDNIYNNMSDDTLSILYQLLAEREEFEAISHAGMPTYQQHVDFVNRKPYKAWYLIKVTDTEVGIKDKVVGSIYLSFGNEIGVAIFRRYRLNGYASSAINSMMTMHNEKFYLANINPKNAKSIKLFSEKFGFTLIQHTYKVERKDDAVS